MSINPEGEANLYSQEPVDPLVNPPAFEESMAERYGGDPVEWIPEADALRRKVAESVNSGGPLIMISSTPENSGIFAGYHKIKVATRSITQEDSMLIREVYATPEQYKSRRIIIPREGLFAKDIPPGLDKLA